MYCMYTYTQYMFTCTQYPRCIMCYNMYTSCSAVYSYMYITVAVHVGHRRGVVITCINNGTACKHYSLSRVKPTDIYIEGQPTLVSECACVNPRQGYSAQRPSQDRPSNYCLCACMCICIHILPHRACFVSPWAVVDLV